MQEHWRTASDQTADLLMAENSGSSALVRDLERKLEKAKDERNAFRARFEDERARRAAEAIARKMTEKN